MKQQVYNPILPLWEYIPDAEPHAFEGRLYLFGSHDVEGGSRYCAAGNYVAWSAPTDDLSDWRYDGVIYEASRDPKYVPGENNDLYAPDVVRGNDGRYYLYYNLVNNSVSSGHDRIGVAVCDTPAGRYAYYGDVRLPDGSPYRPYLDADPAVINDGGVIRLYHGWSLSMVATQAHNRGREQSGAASAVTPSAVPPAMLKMAYKRLFGRTDEELTGLACPLMGANTVELEDDMLTVRGEVHRIVPGQFDTPPESSFYGHSFYEASSIRKINGRYYFIYSSENSHELCYATSAYPDRDFVYGGTIVSNGDIGYQGRKEADRLNMTANNHGSLACVNGQWYIFYHRQTHNSTFSRQVCAEPVTIAPDGSIAQVECTSCGLNGGPLRAEGSYPAAIACNLTNGHMPHITNRVGGFDIPYLTHECADGETLRFLTNLKDGSMAVYKCFAFSGKTRLTVSARGAGGTLEAALDGVPCGSISLAAADVWTESSLSLDFTGTASLSLTYRGEGAADLLALTFTRL